jgi:glycosyltransferase involved in cell wall biosynthesis
MSDSKLDIVMYAGPGMEIYTPETVKKTGIGGSELMFIEMAKRLVALGHKVRAYAGCGELGEGVYDGVEYFHPGRYHDLVCDVLIISRDAAMIDDSFNITSRLKLLWVHDVWAGNATNARLLKYDRILALSQWHKENLIRSHNVHGDHIIITRNGIDLTRFDRKDIIRNKVKCINSSSPDRSFPVLLSIWPTIKSKVPNAELHLYYGFKNWKIAAQYNPGQPELIESLEKQIENMKSIGVIYHDRISQKELAEEFLSAGCLLFPSWFVETSYIGGMECQAAGVRFIGSAIGATVETVGDRGVLISGEWTSPEYQGKFIDAAVKAMTYKGNEDRLELQKYAREHFGLDELAKDWEKMFFNLMEEMKTNPIVPYMPTTPYRIGGRGYYDGDTRIKK